MTASRRQEDASEGMEGPTGGGWTRRASERFSGKPVTVIGPDLPPTPPKAENHALKRFPVS